MGVDTVDVPEHSRVEGIGERIAEDLCQVWVFEMWEKIIYHFLGCWRAEFATVGMGSLVGELEGALAEWLAVVLSVGRMGKLGG